MREGKPATFAHIAFRSGNVLQFTAAFRAIAHGIRLFLFIPLSRCDVEGRKIAFGFEWHMTKNS